jgi:hypothetical protein
MLYRTIWGYLWKLGMRQGAMVGNEGEEGVEFWEDGTENIHVPIEEKRAAQEEDLKNITQG